MILVKVVYHIKLVIRRDLTCRYQVSITSGKHVRVMYTPQTPLLYSKTGVCRGIPIFLIFAPKHRLWVLVRTASPRRFLRVPTIYVLSKKKEKYQFFSAENFHFLSSNNLCLLHGQVFVMTCIRVQNTSQADINL